MKAVDFELGESRKHTPAPRRKRQFRRTAPPASQGRAQARQGQPVQLTLCGECAGASFTLQPRSLIQRLRNRWSAPSWPALLESL